MESRRFEWPLAFTAVSLAIVLAGLYVFKELREVPGDIVDSGRAVLHDLRDVAKAFSEGTVETSFLTFATEISGTSYLQFATLEQMELFRREDYATTLWGQLELPEVVIEATAPVQYTYYLDLEGDWNFELDGDTVHVRAPSIRFNKPAIDPSQLRFDVRSESWFRDEDEAIEKLRAGLTAMARQKAQANVDLVRETGRRKTEDFVATWLLTEIGAPADRSRWRVEVVFADEETPLLRARRSETIDAAPEQPDP